MAYVMLFGLKQIYQGLIRDECRWRWWWWWCKLCVQWSIWLFWV